MRTARIVAPTDLPVSILAVRLHLRDPENTENSEILGFIKSAVETVEHRTGRVLLSQTWETYLDSFPYAWSMGHTRQWVDYIELPHAPVQSVTSVSYLDTAGDSQTLDASGYVVDTSGTPALVRLAYGATWPATYTAQNAVTVRYVAGYSDIDLVPESIIHWIKLFVETADKHRGMATEKQFSMSPFAEGLLDKHKADLGV